MAQTTTHRIFEGEKNADGCAYGIELIVTSPIRERGKTIEHEYNPVYLDPDVLDDIKEKHAENVENDEEPIYLDNSVLAHNIDEETLNALVCEADFDVDSWAPNNLKSLQNVIGYAEKSSISPREAECQYYKHEGYARKEIAAILGIGFTTVKGHLSRSKQTMDAVDDELQKWGATKTFAEVIGYR